MTTILISSSKRLLNSISFTLFSVILSCSFVLEYIPSLSSFCLSHCVCFFILHRSAMSPSLEMMTACRRCPVGDSETIPAGHQSQVFQRGPLCGFFAPFCNSWATNAMNSLLGGAGLQPRCLQDLIPTVARLLVWRGWPSRVRTAVKGHQCWLSLPSKCVRMESHGRTMIWAGAAFQEHWDLSCLRVGSDLYGQVGLGRTSGEDRGQIEQC